MKITTATTEGLRIGDSFYLTIPMLDMRPWPRFKAWMLRRPPPVRNDRRLFKVTNVVTGCTLEGEVES